MHTTHAKRTKNKEVTDKKKEGRGFLLLSYKKVTVQCTRKKDNDSGVKWSGLPLQLFSKKLTSRSSWEQEKLVEPRKKSATFNKCIQSSICKFVISIAWWQSTIPNPYMNHTVNSVIT